MPTTRATFVSSLLLGAGCSLPSMEEGSPDFPQGTSSEPSRRGADLIVELGCGACHAIPGIRTARGRMGPPLDAYAHRAVIAGRLPNTQDNLANWIRDAPAIDDRTAMPAFAIGDRQARDIVAFLYATP